MDGTHRLKVKIGAHEFEAEGPADVVQAQFEAFKQMIAVTPAPGGGDAESISDRTIHVTDGALEHIMRVDGRVVSLTARPATVEEAALLILYGQKILRKNEAVTGAEILWGLERTGGFDTSRTDRILEKLSADVLSQGARRAKRYRLNNSGSAKARRVAAELVSTVA